MNEILRPVTNEDLKEATAIWNEIVEEGTSFPGDTLLSEAEASEMFKNQTATWGIEINGKLAGLYILHPNGFGHTACIANASYTIKKQYRGQGLGKKLVLDSIEKARAAGFKGLQFNAVVSSNIPAIALYLKLGFSIIGTIKNGYRLSDGSFIDIIIFLKSF